MLALLLIVFGSNFAHANIGEAYGFGSRASALAGAGVAWGFEGYATYYNPGALVLTGDVQDPVTGKYQDKRLLLSWSFLAMVPKFTPITGVVTETGYTSDVSTPTVSDVDTSYRNTIAQTFGISYMLFPDWHRVTLGINASLPVEQLAYMDTGEAFIPEYFLYRSRTQRPQVQVAAAAEVAPGFSIGGGLFSAFSLTSNASVYLQSADNRPSIMRFSSSLKPKLAPYLGLFLTSDRDLRANRPHSYSGGLTVRAPVTSANTMILQSGAELFGENGGFDFNFKAASALFYDPLSIELGGSFQVTDFWRAIAQVDYQAWGKFESPALLITDSQLGACASDPTKCPVKIQPGDNPSFQTRDIFVPRVGSEFNWGQTQFRVGYGFRPSILKFIPNASGNYLDPPKHMFTAGVGIPFRHFLHFEVPWHLDLHAAYHQLVSQTIVKNPGDELDQGATNSKIGAPGYTAGGKIFGGGLSLTLDF